MPRGYLPIAYDGVGNILTLGINEGNKGGIYRISATDDPGYETYKKYSPKLLSENFSVFLNGLKAEFEDKF